MKEIKNNFKNSIFNSKYSSFLQELETKEEMDCGANLCVFNENCIGRAGSGCGAKSRR